MESGPCIDHGSISKVLGDLLKDSGSSCEVVANGGRSRGYQKGIDVSQIKGYPRSQLFTHISLLVLGRE